MKRKILSIVLTLVLVLSFSLVTAVPAGAAETSSVFQSGGDRLVETQNNDGGWDWPLLDLDPDTGSAINTPGPIGIGLAQAYRQTDDSAMYAALEAAGGFLLAEDHYFTCWDGLLAVELDDILGVTTYTDNVKANFYDKLAAGTYVGKAGPENPYTTEEYIAAAGYAWDLGIGLASAVSVGIAESEIDKWITGVKDAINATPYPDPWFLTDLAGGVYGLAYAGEIEFTGSGHFQGKTTVAELATELASMQDVSSGCFDPGFEMDGQNTAYALLALNQVDSSSYMDNIAGAGVYLDNTQLETGGWENYAGEGENNEMTAEALWALASVPVRVTIGDLEYFSIQSAIDSASPEDTISVAAGKYNETVELKDTTATGISIIGQDKTTTFITGGICFAADYSGLKVQNFTITGNGFLLTETYQATVSCHWFGHYAVTDLEFSDCIFDGENIDDGKGGRCGIVIKRLGGVVKFVNNDFKNYPGWATLDVNDGSGGGALTVTSYTLINNDFLDNGGGCALRGNPEDYTDMVMVTENTFNGPAGWAALEINQADNVEIYDNEIRNVEEFSDWGEGQAMQLWKVGTVEIYENTIENNYQGIAILNYPEPYDISNISVHHNYFSGNAEYALSVDDGLIGDPLDAECNWWGDATGADNADNPHGTGKGGDVVSANVDFTPWYATATTTPDTEHVSVDHDFSSVIALSDTIQGGIDAALADDTIEVAAGTYDEQVIIDKDVTLLGANHEVNPVTAGRGTEAIINGGGTGDAVTISADGVTFKGFEVTNGTMGIVAGARSGLTISNNIIHHNVNPKDQQGCGITIWAAAGPCDNNLIENNVVYSNEREGIFIGTNEAESNSTGNVIRGNKVYDNGTDGYDSFGIQLNYASGNTIENNEVYGHTHTSVSWLASGIYLYNANNNNILGNNIHDNNNGICQWIPDGTVQALEDNEAHLNNVVNNTENGARNFTAEVTLDATYNWWDDETGPSHDTLNPGGQGNAVSNDVDFSPWLYDTQENFVSDAPCYAGSVVLGNEATQVEDEPVSYAGGWNSFSTPVTLDGSADSISELLDLLAAEGSSSIVRAQRFDPSTQKWVPLVMGGSLFEDKDYEIKPGEGFFIQVSTKGSLPILCLTTPTTSPPMTNLVAGWNLVGLSNFTGMTVESALHKVDYSVVISPSPNAKSWSVPPLDGKSMELGEAYWLAMPQPGILFGHTTTPVADNMTWELNK